MTNKGISEIPLFDPIFLKMDCPLFGVTTVVQKKFKLTEAGFPSNRYGRILISPSRCILEIRLEFVQNSID